MPGSIKFSVTEPNIVNIVPSYTNIDWEKLFVANTIIQDSEFKSIKVNDNNFESSECILMSSSLEKIYLSNTYKSSYTIRADLTSNNTWVSPLIDLRQMHAVIIGNVINFDLTGETTPQSGLALSKYISKQIPLSIESSDLQVYLTVYKPKDTDIAVFGKFKHSEDITKFDDHNWVRLYSRGDNLVSSDLDIYDFSELAYEMPTEVMTGENGEYQYKNPEGITFTGFNTFSIKIVLLSHDAAKVPRVKNARGIALQL
jgi:hypothetical protein